MIKQYCVALILASVSVSAVAETQLDDKQKLSYLLGQNTAKSMISKDIAIDPEAFLNGMKDALASKPSLLSDAEGNQVMMQFQATMQAKAQEKAAKLSAENIAAGKAFITEYNARKGVISLDNGISYSVIKEGNGVQPKASDTVVAHYTGKLVDGKVFDSSVTRGQPSTFPLKNVIKGWQEVLPLMKIGAKWEVVIPPQLAYGERGPGGVIGPNSTLVFEIELLEIKQP
ncbi:MAG: FKBP-type peptidyl-prolyl cis-trans isomerase [Gammaproteobacteria bacterium]|nr:FKBP-type peptidyl-prolyl cis-trans isomerase [Gammaproteobacteria bacterium]